MKLLLDEHYPPVLAQEMRHRGFDVVAVAETGAMVGGGMGGLRDLPLLRQATAAGRVLVTENARDFVRIHRELLAQGETHAGIMLTSWRRYSRERDAVGRLILALGGFMEVHESLSGQIVWL